MNVYHSIEAFSSEKKTIATIGTFDGVHIGHRKIIEKLVDIAHDMHCESLILTFFPHPRMVLGQKSDILLLNTMDEKKQLLQKAGLNNLIIHPFDESFSRLSAEEFVKKVLVDTFNISKIIIGHDHRFGQNRSADINDLIKFGNIYGFEVEQIRAEEIENVSVSSTKIRKALQDGNIALANSYLGYNYFFTGNVVYGKQLGRTIGFPTANLQILEDYKLIPKMGVYVVSSEFNGKVVYGLMNIGTNPTVDGKDLSIEVHYFDLEADLYGKIIQVSVLQYIRNEQKFDSLQLLKDQINMDKASAKRYLSNR